MKKILLLLFPLSLIAQSGIVFKDQNWETTLSEAKRTNKLIFMDAYTTWCGPCKAMEKYTFTDPAVGEFFNASFINVRFDMEQYPGMEFAEKYNVSIYPNLLFINGDGELVHRGCGALETDELLVLGKEAITPELTLQALRKRYEAGERSTSFMDTYITALATACQDIDGFFKKHFSNIPDEQLNSVDNWYLIKTYIGDLYSREFQYILKNQTRFDANEVQDKIYETFMQNYYEMAEAEAFALFGVKSIKYMAEQHEFKKKEEFLRMLEFGLGEISEDWEMYARGAVSFIRPETEDQELILDVAWKFYLFVNDKEQLLKALNWTKYVLDNYEPDPAIIDTYASLLYKLGKKPEAIKFEQQALQLAQSWGEDTSHYEFQLTKFKK
jgi:thioredoxin-related protein